MEIVPGAGWGCNFGMIAPNAPPPAYAKAWAKSGWGNFYLTNPQNKKDIQMVWKYGHSTYQPSGACVDIKGTLSIAFASNVDTMCARDSIFKIPEPIQIQ